MLTEFHFFSLTQDADIETLDNRYLKQTGGYLTETSDRTISALYVGVSRLLMQDNDGNTKTT